MSTIVDEILTKCETIKTQASSLAVELNRVKVFDVKNDDLLDLLVPKINQYKKFTTDSITEVVIPDTDSSITEIPAYAFAGCSQLSSVTLSNNITTIKDNAFENCKSLKSIIIPASVKTIGNLAFSGCTSLSSIYLPISIKTIGSDVFKDCTNLTKISVDWRADSVSGAPWGANGSNVVIMYLQPTYFREYYMKGFTIDKSSSTNTEIISSDNTAEGLTISMPSSGSVACFFKTPNKDLDPPYEVTITSRISGSNGTPMKISVKNTDGLYIKNNGYNYFGWSNDVEFSSGAYGTISLSWGYNLKIVDKYSSGKLVNREETKEQI